MSYYWEKVGKGVSESILSNNVEISRRSKQMLELNEIIWKDPEYRTKMSEIAKKTSSRPEVIKKRSVQLKKWRTENPEDFFNKCTKKMHNSWRSKPEAMLFDFLLKQNGFNFKRNQFVKSNIFNWKSQRKQIDVADKGKRIYVEFDGVFHFKPIFGDDKLAEIKGRDSLLEIYIKSHNWTLIRISYDQFNYKQGGYFAKDCLDKLVKILVDSNRGIFKIGQCYEQYKKY